MGTAGVSAISNLVGVCTIYMMMMGLGGCSRFKMMLRERVVHIAGCRT